MLLLIYLTNRFCSISKKIQKQRLLLLIHTGRLSYGMENVIQKQRLLLLIQQWQENKEVKKQNSKTTFVTVNPIDNEHYYLN